MQRIKQSKPLNKGKLSVLALALAGAVSAIGAAHAQTVSGTSGQVTWSSTDMLIDSSGVINGTSTAVITGVSSLGTLTNQGTIDTTNIGVLNSGNSAVRIINEANSLIHASTIGIANTANGTIDTISNSGTISGTVAISNLGSTIGTVDNQGTIIGNSYGILNDTNSGTIGTIGTISNSGTISGQIGINNIGIISSLNNTVGGYINGSNTGLFNSGSIAAISNSGTVNGNYGVRISSSGTITSLLNDTNALISGSNIALYNAGLISTLSNSGTISGNTGIYNISNATIGTLINQAGGLIIGSGGSSGINNGGHIGTISNSGTITGNNGISNASTIEILNNETGSLISGTLQAIYNTGSIGSISNSGTITSATIGSGTIGISNTGTITSLSNAASGTISGNGGSGINNGGTIGTISNSGTISGAWGISNDGTIGTLSNDTGGLITGTAQGMHSTGSIGSISNSGTISGLWALYNDGGTIASLTNSGTISAANVSGIINDSGTITSLVNSGVIKGGTVYNNSTNAAGINNAGTGFIGTLTNSGSIGGYDGIVNAGTISMLSNTSDTVTGTIHGSNYAINNSGTISQLSNAGSISGNTGIYNTGHINTLSNATTGTIRGTSKGVYNSIGGSINLLSNAGSISGNITGILNSGSIGSISNTGIITSASSSAIKNTGTIGTISNSGTISGNKGIDNNGTIGTLNNSGLIRGSVAAVYLDNSSTLGNITNSGTIAGTILNLSSNALTIAGGTGTIFGTLTGYSGGISTSDIGRIISTGDLTFSSGNMLLNDNVTVNAGNGTFTNAGVLQVNNVVTITGNYAQDANASLIAAVSSSASVSGSMSDSGYGRLIVDGNAVVAAGSAITVKSLGYSLAQGQRYVVISASGGSTNYNASSLVYSSGGYNVTASVQTDSSNSSYTDLVLTLGSTDNTSTGGSSNTSPINNATTGNAISALGGLFKYSGTDATLLAVFNPATGLGTTAANKAGAQLSPSAVTTAASKAVDAATQAISNVVASHLDGFHLAQAGNSGVATGERSAEIATWGQIFGGRASQGLRDNVSGYHANYRGLLIGTDGLVTDQIRAGALISAAKTSVASDGDNTGSSAEVNNYGLTAYATYTGSPWYVNALAGAMRQQYSTVRTISYTGFSGVADGSFHGSQYVTSVQAGYPLNLDAWLPGATLTPIAGLSYSTLRQNGYTETGGNGAALSVKASSSNSLKSELGAKLENTYVVSYGKLLPSVQLGWRHEYKDKATQTGASFVADSTGSTAFTTQSATPVANVGVLNLGVTLVQSNNLSLTGKYTLESGGGYTAQTGSVQVRWQY